MTATVESIHRNDLVTYDGRACVLRGADPGGVRDRRAYLEDTATGERLAIPLDAVTRAARHRLHRCLHTTATPPAQPTV